ncbi:MAG TPA: cell wall hydrolase, partial [Caulobacteraceae bacterium]
MVAKRLHPRYLRLAAAAFMIAMGVCGMVFAYGHPGPLAGPMNGPLTPASCPPAGALAGCVTGGAGPDSGSLLPATFDAPPAGTQLQNLDVSPAQALAINASIPFSPGPVTPAPRLVLRDDAPERAKSLTCLTQAIYYEAGREPPAGARAVAQVVLNRLRHPAFPKTVCGVVFQGSGLRTGCQFTFTCDGSLARAPDAGLWARAQAVAATALAGEVEPLVGTSTHYHAVYVAPVWNRTMVKVVQIGGHIFYRWDARGPLAGGAPGVPQPGVVL